MPKMAGILAGALLATAAVGGITWRLAKASPITSGVRVGELLTEFRPRHVSGADKGTWVCPVCEYPNNPAVQVWVNGDDETNVAIIAASLERATRAYRDKKLKAFIIYVNADHQTDGRMIKQLEAASAKNRLKNVALAFLRGDSNATRDNQINTDRGVKNTVFVYMARKVSAKFINLAGDKQGLDKLETAVHEVVK